MSTEPNDSIDLSTHINNPTNNPTNIEEKIIWYAIRYTWIFYLFGALYIVGPAVAWILLCLLIIRFVNGDSIKLPFGISCWSLGMIIMLIAVVISHINLDLSLTSLIKSSIGWAKGWALMAIFPALALLNIRKEILIRACMHLCLQTLCLIPLLIIAPFIGLPDYLYTSPLKFLAAHSFFEVELYGINAFDGLPRWRMFAPWGPALGLMGNLLCILSWQEHNKRWRWIGIIAAMMMVILSKSRMGILCFILIPLIIWSVANIRHVVILIIIAIAAPIIAASVAPSVHVFENARSEIHASRADSSRVRGALARIALHRWKNEAPIWGHGIVEKGPHYVEYMPIGSHHSWLGLLFVKGIVGFFALAIPMLVSYIVLLSRLWLESPNKLGLVSLNKTSCTPLGILLLLSFYSLTENLEILAYLYWPGLILIGSQFIQKRMIQVNTPPAHQN